VYLAVGRVESTLALEENKAQKLRRFQSERTESQPASLSDGFGNGVQPHFE
jgi:hypothetical protein